MKSACPDCGCPLAPEQPVCTECGRAIAGAMGGSAGGGLDGGPRPLAGAPLLPRATNAGRDKEKDFLLVGKVIAGKYRVLGVLGQGGFGTVYLVEITAGMVGERLALKVLPQELSSQPAFRDLFLNEIRIAMRLVDRYIVQIRDVGVTEDDLLYYTMDYCPGTTLADVLRAEGKLSITRALVILLNVLRALQTAHAAGIVHRDLKPANLMIESQAGKDSVRVLDLGIATAVQAQAGKKIGFAGSPHYVPPEQFLGEDVGFSSDLYSLGAILYECVTGARPYGGATAQEVFRNLKARSPAPPETYNPAVRSWPGLSELMLKSLEKNPERRYQSAKELFDEVNAILLTGTVPEGDTATAATAAASAPPPPPLPRPAPAAGAAAAARKPVRRRASYARPQRSHAGAVGAVVFAAGLLAAGLIVYKLVVEPRLSASPRDPEEGTPPPLAADAGGDSTRARPRDPGAARNERARRAATAAPALAPPPEAKAEAQAGERSAADLEAAAELAGRAEHALSAARKAFGSGNWAEAIDRAETALRMAPGSAGAMEVRGLAALRAGDAAAAEAWLGKTWEARGAAGTPAPVILAYAEAKLGLSPPRLEEARNLAESVLRKSPRDPAAVAVLARVLEKQGNAKDLARLVAAAKKGKVESPEIEARWRKIFVDEPARRREEAGRFARAAAEAFEKGDLEKAADLAAEANRTFPTVEAALLAAESFLELGRPEKGVKVIAGMLANAPAAPVEEDEEDATWGDEIPAPESADLPAAERAALEAALHYLQGRAALDAAEKEKDPADLLAEAEGSFVKAIETLGGAPGDDGKRRQALARLGVARIHALRGDADKVLEVVKPFENHPDPAVAAEESRVYYLLGRRTGSLEGKVKAYTLARKNFLALVRLRGVKDGVKREAHRLAGLASLRLADVEGNERHYRSALESFAAARQAGLNTADLHEDWALAYDRVGNFVKAAQLLRAAYEIEPTPAACLRAADACLKANPKSPDAAAVLKDGAARFEKNAEVQKRYRELTGP